MNRKEIDHQMRASVEQHLRELRGAEPRDLHQLFIAAAERPLLEAVLRHAGGNQSKAAEWLGINRNTLRRKLIEHRIQQTGRTP
jgi:Fis family transcriptional regulator